MSITLDFPEYVRQVFVESSEVNLVRLSAARDDAPCADPILISVVKNELDRLPELLAHYRWLDVERFVILDNGSTDGSIEYLSAQPDVDLYAVDRRFVWPYKQGWINRVIAEYGYDHWYIYVDADEHIVFDQAGAFGFNDLIAMAERLGICRVRGMLIDMYAAGPLLEYQWKTGSSLIQTYPLFDSDSYVEQNFKEIISRKGGPRRRRFKDADGAFNPEMSKYPLFKLQPGELFANPHHIYPYARNMESKCYLGMLHFKFLPGFIDRVHKAIQEKTYWDGSSEYRRYLDKLTENPNLSLEYEGSRAYRSPRDFIDCQLIESIDWSGASMRGHAHNKLAIPGATHEQTWS